MQRKRSEGELGTMMRHRYHYFTYKWRDRGYVSCPRCHRTLRMCPFCRQDMLLSKAETYPDFMFAKEWGYVEVKEAPERFNWKSDISPNQYRVMQTHKDSWLFLEMGPGPAPQKRSAFLIPWKDWLEFEVELGEQGIGSIVWDRGPRGKSPIAREYLAWYACEWNEGGWIIPTGHIFWSTHTPNEAADE